MDQNHAHGYILGWNLLDPIVESSKMNLTLWLHKRVKRVSYIQSNAACSKFGTSNLNCYLIAHFISCFMMSYDVLWATNHPAETACCRQVSTGCSTDPVVSNFSEISEPSRRVLLRRPEEWNQWNIMESWKFLKVEWQKGAIQPTWIN